MIHPETYVKNTPKGLGLFARRPFKKGEIIWIVDDVDIKIPIEEYHSLDTFQQRKVNIYSYLDNKNRVIVPWDEGKYVNHSCAPNSTGLLQFDNISIALKDIDTDEEIVEDYYSYFGHFETFVCQCGAPNCRGLIAMDNTYSEALRLDISEFSHDILNRPQPLLEVHSEENTEFLSILRQYSHNGIKANP